ncbi:MAG: alanine racemase C-terminal domain-containing protein [Sulfurimonas sp.]|nr:alanine racemase C-terminal domain-containing protein [Sulfurimonas sp.]
MASGFDLEAFKPVLSLYASKISSRKLEKNQALGYGATFTADADLEVSNYNFGYGDGFLRTASNSFTTPNGEKLLGRISMDNSSFVSNKDEILIFNDARVLATSAKTLSYEVLTSLKKRLKRKIV